MIMMMMMTFIMITMTLAMKEGIVLVGVYQLKDGTAMNNMIGGNAPKESSGCSVEFHVVLFHVQPEGNS